MEKRKLVILTGPTAVGKSALSIALAKKINGEIISADSMQVYRGMDIGSAKITKDEMDGVKHHLIDVLDPKEPFNIVLFQQLAHKAMEEIYEAGKIPVIVGGTGFYIQSILYEVDFAEEKADSSYRQLLEEKAGKEGTHALWEMLQSVDPKAAMEIHEHNTKRVIRALEYFHENGTRISEHNEEQRQKISPYDYSYFVLNDEREKLYAKIDARVDLMLEQGLIDEVKGLLARGCNLTDISMQGLGYKEIIHYLEDDYSLDEAVYRIKRDTRHFAKRQLTWFRRERDVTWIYKPDFQYNEEKMLTFMAGIITEGSK